MMPGFVAVGPDTVDQVDDFCAEQMIQWDWVRRDMPCTKILAFLTPERAEEACYRFQEQGTDCVCVSGDDVRYLLTDLTQVEIGEEDRDCIRDILTKLHAFEQAVLSERLQEALDRLEVAPGGGYACALMNHYEKLHKSLDEWKEPAQLHQMPWNIDELFEDDGSVEAVHPDGTVLLWTDYKGWVHMPALEYFLDSRRVVCFEDLDEDDQTEYTFIKETLEAAAD